MRFPNKRVSPLHFARVHSPDQKELFFLSPTHTPYAQWPAQDLHSARPKRMVTPSSLFISTILSKIVRTNLGAIPSDGSSSKSIFGLDISARAIASICCSPPESVPPCCQMRSLSRGKIGNVRSISTLDTFRVFPKIRSHAQIFLNCKISEDHATLRCLRETELHNIMRLDMR